MKNIKLHFFFFLVFTAAYSQDEPDPFNDTPPDFIPPSPIDENIFILYLLVIMWVFIILRNRSKSNY